MRTEKSPCSVCRAPDQPWAEHLTAAAEVLVKRYKINPELPGWHGLLHDTAVALAGGKPVDKPPADGRVTEQPVALAVSGKPPLPAFTPVSRPISERPVGEQFTLGLD